MLLSRTVPIGYQLISRQASLSLANVVPGIGRSPDKMQLRIFSLGGRTSISPRCQELGKLIGQQTEIFGHVEYMNTGLITKA